MVETPDELSYCGIYDNSKDLHSYEFLMNSDTLQAMINLARSKDKQFDPMVWMINVSKKHKYSILLYLFTEKFMILRI
jgi:hypothetical protein